MDNIGKGRRGGDYNAIVFVGRRILMGEKAGRTRFGGRRGRDSPLKRENFAPHNTLLRICYA